MQNCGAARLTKQQRTHHRSITYRLKKKSSKSVQYSGLYVALHLVGQGVPAARQLPDIGYISRITGPIWARDGSNEWPRGGLQFGDKNLKIQISRQKWSRREGLKTPYLELCWADFGRVKPKRKPIRLCIFLCVT